MVAVLVIVGVVLYLALGAYLWYRTWTGFLRALDERYPRLPRSVWERRDTYITAGCAIFWPIMVPLGMKRNREFRAETRLLEKLHVTGLGTSGTLWS